VLTLSIQWVEIDPVQTIIAGVIIGEVKYFGAFGLGGNGRSAAPMGGAPLHERQNWTGEDLAAKIMVMMTTGR
jgi:hypothetical protein